MGLGVTTSTGAALIELGLATTTYHAQDLSFASPSAIGSYTTFKNDSGTPRSNENQNKQFNDAVKEIGRKIGRELSKDQRSKLHRDVSGRNYGYHEIVEEGIGLFE